MRGWYFVLALTACYHRASETACALSCADGVCPSGMECGGNGLCHATGEPECNGAPLDAPGDALGDGRGPPCFGTGILRICLQTLPTSDLQILAQMESTDAGGSPLPCASGLTITGTTSVCVIVARNITMGTSATVTVTGSRPLVLLATGDLTISGTIDASSSTPGSRLGAGAPQTCAAPNQTPVATTAMIGNGGGAGGTFGKQGGIGGPSGTHMGGTAPAPATAFATLAGGCPGGAGGTSGNSSGGAGGFGGGAVYLISGGMLRVTGTILVNGAAGSGGLVYAGGGGGGAGGYIGLDGVSYLVQSGATLAAVGGGGGTGGGTSVGGNPGSESVSAAAAAVTTSSDGGGNGGMGTGDSGGPGGAAPASTQLGGGGGGGGAGGVIGVANLAAFSAPGAMLNPSPTQMP